MTNDNGDLLLDSIEEEGSGYYQCINLVDDSTLQSYHVVVNSLSNLTGITKIPNNSKTL